MSAIKICGIYRNEDVEPINRYKPDYFGMIIDFKRSHRSISRKEASMLRDAIDKSIPAVGVFVNKEPSYIKDFVDDGIIDIAQLHGLEDNDYIRRLKSLICRPVWKAFKIRIKEDIRQAMLSEADLIILDNGYGTGETFDWSLIQDVKRPFALAGGMNLENIEAALNSLNPYLIDISSGVETDKLKDPDKIEKAVKAVHDFERRQICQKDDLVFTEDNISRKH